MTLHIREITTIYIASLLVATVVLCGCNANGRKGGDDRVNANSDLSFAELSDSIKLMAGNAGAYCDSLMAQATDSTEYYSFYVWKGNSYIYSTTPDSALPYAQAVRRFTASKPQSPRIMALSAIANSLEAQIYHIMRKNTEKSIELYTLSLNQIMHSDYIEMSPDIAANLADAYIYANDITTAAKWYRKAIFLVDSLKLPTERNITLYMGLGQIYTTLEDYTSAQHMYEQTELQYDKMKPNMQSYFLMCYGNYYYYKGDYANALKTFKRLERHLQTENSGNNMDAQTCNINIADVYLNLGHTDSAAIYVEKAAPYFEANGVDLGVYYANTIRIGIALRRSDYQRIERILATEGRIDVKDQNIKNIRSRYLTNYYAATGNYRKAFANVVTNQRQKDSTEHSRQNMRASEIMARLSEDTLRLHYELELKDRNAQVQRSRAMLTIAFGGIVVLASLAVASVMIARKRRLQASMEIFMLRLAAIRQRISPHFVFNVLNAKIGDAPKSESDALVDMAKLIRQNLELSNRQYVSLYEELNFVKSYVNLQRTLIGKDMEFTIVAPDDDTLEEIKIPSMFVQILVENSIKHGLKCIDGPKRLNITVACCANNKASITVTDNGPGFDITRRSPNSTHTGFDVISRTMAVLNRHNKRSSRMEMSIENIEDGNGRIAGCRSTLTIPLDMKFT